MNQEGALDCVSDSTSGNRRLRILTVVDVWTRECLALEVDTSIPRRRVTRVLERLIARHGSPQVLRSDNGPELRSRHYLAWCIDRGVQTVHIQSGRPMQDGCVESSNGRLRDECLNASWFWNLWNARRKKRGVERGVHHAQTTLCAALSEASGECYGGEGLERSCMT